MSSLLLRGFDLLAPVRLLPTRRLCGLETNLADDDRARSTLHLQLACVVTAANWRTLGNRWHWII